ncbi:hypothetical protein [Gemmatimonas sp.]|uniref:hypothetical protein n=1 Tax=Gemmatimonas sp. TaxID=1962908 RepID=UPI0039839877
MFFKWFVVDPRGVLVNPRQGNTVGIPPPHGVTGTCSNRAPSQAEPVRFDGAGSGTFIPTNAQSDDSGTAAHDGARRWAAGKLRRAGRPSRGR